MKKWLLNKALKWFPYERIAAIMLERLLDHSDTRPRARDALKIAQRILEAVHALVAALRNLLADEVTETTVLELKESAAKIALKAWARGELTPPEARHLKERKDESP